jgi:gliding motility-associated lipoprotein GldH
MKIKLQQTITMRTKSLNKFAFLVSLLLLVSCDSNKVYDEYVAINPEGWISTETIDFSVELNSTQGDLYDVLIALRNNNDYLYSNLFLFVEVENPMGETSIDTLQYLVAEPNGSWVGTGIGSIKHNLFKYKESQDLQTGIYKFKIRQGMRSHILLGLEDIGIRIESVN